MLSKYLTIAYLNHHRNYANGSWNPKRFLTSTLSKFYVRKCITIHLASVPPFKIGRKLVGWAKRGAWTKQGGSLSVISVVFNEHWSRKSMGSGPRGNGDTARLFTRARVARLLEPRRLLAKRFIVPRRLNVGKDNGNFCSLESFPDSRQFTNWIEKLGNFSKERNFPFELFERRDAKKRFLAKNLGQGFILIWKFPHV